MSEAMFRETGPVSVDRPVADSAVPGPLSIPTAILRHRRVRTTGAMRRRRVVFAAPFAEWGRKGSDCHVL